MDKFSLKVMIVDDEENVRNLLKACIDWEEIGAEISGEASSGSEALDLLDELNPDIIITDIRMPYMDGLEFAGIAVERNPNVKIIVLTAYEEFEYAQKGIKIGVADFLLKPVKRADLKSALISLKQKIEAEKVSKEEYHQLKERLSENFPYIKEKFLYDLLHGNYDNDDLTEKLVYFSEDGLLKHAQAALIRPSWNKPGQYGREEEIMLLDFACIGFVKDYFKNTEGVNVLSGTDHRIIVLNSNPAVDIVRACEQIRSLAAHRFGCDVSVGVGTAGTDFKGIRKSYKEACDALNYKVVYGKNQVICFNDISINSRSPAIISDEINEIGFYIKAGMEEKSLDIIEKAFNDLIAAKSIDTDQIRVLSVHIATLVLNSIAELGLNFEDIFVSEPLPYNRILKIETIPEMKEYLNGLVSSVVRALKTAMKKKSGKVMNEILAYVEEHITDSKLSLSGVAGTFFLNPSYLSRIFKQETGYTFVEYLKKIRIEKAIKLLNETDLKAYEIGESVGIPDPNYFGKCFKKYTGLSVNDFKRLK